MSDATAQDARGADEQKLNARQVAQLEKAIRDKYVLLKRSDIKWVATVAAAVALVLGVSVVSIARTAANRAIEGEVIKEAEAQARASAVQAKSAEGKAVAAAESTAAQLQLAATHAAQAESHAKRAKTGADAAYGQADALKKLEKAAQHAARLVLILSYFNEAERQKHHGTGGHNAAVGLMDKAVKESTAFRDMWPKDTFWWREWEHYRLSAVNTPLRKR